MLRQRQTPGPPVEPAQLQAAQVPDPQAEPGGQQDHRVVAFPDRGLPVNLVQDQANLLSRPRVRGRLAAPGIALRRKAGQVVADLPGLVQVTQEVGQRRAQRAGRLRGVAPQLAAGPEPGQVPGLRLAEGFPARLVEVAQEQVRGALLGRDAGLGVAPPARREVTVPGRAEPRRAPYWRRRRGLANLGKAPSGPPSAVRAGARAGRPGGTGSRRLAAWRRAGSAVSRGSPASAGSATPPASRNPANALNSALWRWIVVVVLPLPSTRRSPALTRRGCLLSP